MIKLPYRPETVVQPTIGGLGVIYKVEGFGKKHVWLRRPGWSFPGARNRMSRRCFNKAICLGTLVHYAQFLRVQEHTRSIESWLRYYLQGKSGLSQEERKPIIAALCDEIERIYNRRNV